MKDTIQCYNDRLNYKFYADDTKKSFENRTSDRSWEIDTSIYASSAFKRYDGDEENPIYLALLEERRLTQKAKNFRRSTPSETFADNHYDPR